MGILCLCLLWECMCVCVYKCAFGSSGLDCWLPEATDLKCVKWGSSQRWALGYEAALKSVCGFMDVCVCHIHIRLMSYSLTHLLMWVTLSLQAFSTAPYYHWHETVLHLVCRVIRQTNDTEVGFEVQSGVKRTERLNYRTWGDNTTNTVHHLNVFVQTMISGRYLFLNGSEKILETNALYLFSFWFLLSFFSFLITHVLVMFLTIMYTIQSFKIIFISYHTIPHIYHFFPPCCLSVLLSFLSSFIPW